LPSYGLIPAISLELLFRLAGIRVPAQIIAGMTSFLILDFSGSIKHLGAYLNHIDNLLSIMKMLIITAGQSYGLIPALWPEFMFF
jgi:hypothetical protein